MLLTRMMCNILASLVNTKNKTPQAIGYTPDPKIRNGLYPYKTFIAEKGY